MSKPSVFTISALIYIFGFLYLLSSNPELFDENNQEKCFMMFFTSGVSAILVYHFVVTFY
mgnify:CR=1 FL=1|jgi:hypothetical protein